MPTIASIRGAQSIQKEDGMLAKKHTVTILAVMALVLMLPIVASSAEIVSDYFFTKPLSAMFCVQLDEHAAGIPVVFTGTTPQGIRFTTGTYLTNVLGEACPCVNWPVGIYSIVANAGNMETTYPYAISIFSPVNFCGAQGGGVVDLDDVNLPPNPSLETLADREADFAFIWRTTSPKNFGIIYHDPKNPIAPVTFIATSFQIVVPQDFGFYQSVKFIGTGKLTVGMNPPKTVHYEMYADDFPGDNLFELKLTDFAGHLLYISDPDDDEETVVEGKNVVELCP